MKNLLLIVSAAAMAFSMPALAQGQGKGKGASANVQKSMNMKRNDRSNGKVRTDVRARTDARANARATTRTGVSIDRSDVNGSGVVNSRNRNRDGISGRTRARPQGAYGGDICPPGLAKKTPACVPPGQAKRIFSEGRRIPSGYRSFTGYNDIPETYRTRVPYSDANRYIYQDDRVYVVDPTTRVVTSIIGLIR